MAETPSWPATLATNDLEERKCCNAFPQPGDTIDDFKLVRVLGQGALGTVFLAEQESLARRVALKITSAVGDEARTMARLEHDHIVRVFSDRVDPQRGLRLTSMQLVCGATLEQIVHRLRAHPRNDWCGQLILDIVDELSQVPTTLDPTALASRETFAGFNFIEAVCWIGEKLAQALDHAHKAGVVHCDVKPGNIMINQYARPMLLDFNLAANASAPEDSVQLVGGTVPYMAPEHLEIYLASPLDQASHVSAKSDLFSLAVVIYELLTGCRPFDANECTRTTLNCTARRFTAPEPLSKYLPDAPENLSRELARGLSRNPTDRHPDCAAFARGLAQCREIVAVECSLPEPGVITKLVKHAPFAMLFLLPALPNILASVLNHTYLFRVVLQQLSSEQQAIFRLLATTYNVTVYPLTLSLAAWWVAPVYRRWPKLRGNELASDEIDAMRQRALSFTTAVIVLSLFGYLSGLAVYAWGTELGAAPVPATVLSGFGLSFAFCGLFAGTMAAFATEFVVLRVLYPKLLPEGTSLTATARRELASHPFRLRRFQLYSCCVPLIAAYLILRLTPAELGNTSYEGWRVMLMLLILVGIAAMALGTAFSAKLNHIVSILKR